MERFLRGVMRHLWINAKTHLKNQIDRKDFISWVEPINFVESEDNVLRLEAPNNFVKRWFNENYLHIIKEFLDDTEDVNVPIELTVADTPAKGQMDFGTRILGISQAEESRDAVAAKATVKRNKVAGINAKYTFDRFIQGPSNQFAKAASQSVAKKPGKAFNPLFIYGGVGLGKTHLINAIGNHVMTGNENARVVSLSSERFMNEMISAIHHNRINAFRNKYRNCEVLLIDDIQFLAGKERTQEEFFHTFNYLHESGSQIVLTSDRVPKDIPDLEERLRSRFGWGLVADIQPPELETRLAILKEKAEEDGIELPDDVAFFLASKFVDNIRELEGAYVRLSAMSSFHGNQITMEEAKKVLRSLIGDVDKVITIDMVQKAVCDFFKVKRNDLLSNRRQKIIAVPRQIGMYLSRKLTSHSYPDIGQEFGGRDHSTVIHAFRKIETESSKDARLLQTLETLEKTLRN